MKEVSEEVFKNWLRCYEGELYRTVDSTMDPVRYFWMDESVRCNGYTVILAVVTEEDNQELRYFLK